MNYRRTVRCKSAPLKRPSLREIRNQRIMIRTPLQHATAFVLRNNNSERVNRPSKTGQDNVVGSRRKDYSRNVTIF